MGNAVAENFIPTDDLGGFRSRWEAIDLFIREWLNCDFGRPVATETICDFESAIGAKLPPAAREWCSFVVASESIREYFSFRDDLVVRPIEHYKAISILMQGESDYYWAIESSDFAQDDPPVSGYFLDHDEVARRFAPAGICAPSVSSFAFEYLLNYLTSRGGNFSTYETSPLFSTEGLEEDLGPSVRFGHLEVFCSNGILAWRTPESEGGKAVGVQLQQEMPADQLPRTVRGLLSHAHCLQGTLARNAVSKGRRTKKRWWALR